MGKEYDDGYKKAQNEAIEYLTKRIQELKIKKSDIPNTLINKGKLLELDGAIKELSALVGADKPKESFFNKITNMWG